MKLTAKKLKMGAISAAVMLLPTIIGNTPVEAQNYESYDRYNECKSNIRRRVVYNYYSGDWEKYDSSSKKRHWEDRAHESCKYIMEGKW